MLRSVGDVAPERATRPGSMAGTGRQSEERCLERFDSPRSLAERARIAFRQRMPGTLYWSIRARRFGPRGVLNLAHDEADAPDVLARQEALLMPLLAERVGVGDHVVLDFGCGPGRFTSTLAATVGRAVGVDPIATYLQMAPRNEGVEYRQIRGGRIPVDSASIDVVWVCLVLGSITKPRDLEHAVAELDRVLRPGGLLFVVENTTPDRADGPTQAYRPASAYTDMLQFANVRVVGGYEDLGESMTVLAGRRGRGA